MRKFTFSKRLKKTLRKLSKKDKSRYDQENDRLYFEDFDHHDNIYKV